MFMTAKVDELIKRREEAGLSMHKLSLISGLGGSSIFRIERGTITLVHPLRAKAIAKALDCKVTDIFEKIITN